MNQIRSSAHAWVDGHLARLGLSHHFTAVLCADDVLPTKPAPALYQAALAALDLRPASSAWPCRMP